MSILEGLSDDGGPVATLREWHRRSPDAEAGRAALRNLWRGQGQFPADETCPEMEVLHARAAMEADIPELALELASHALLEPMRPWLRATATLIARYCSWRLGRSPARTAERSSLPPTGTRSVVVPDLCLAAMREADALRMASARACAQEALTEAASSGDPSLLRLAAAVFADVAHEGGTLTVTWCQRHLSWTEREVPPCAPDAVLVAYRIAADLHAAAGQEGHAIALLKRLDRLGGESAVRRYSVAALSELTNVHLRLGDVAAAERALEDLGDASARGGALRLDESVDLLRAAVRLTWHTGRFHREDRLAQAPELHDEAIRQGKNRAALTVAVQMSIIDEVRGRGADASNRMVRTMARVARSGANRCLLDDADRLRPIVARLRSDPSLPPGPAVCTAWLDRRQRRGRTAPASATDALTPRERVILPLLGKGLSNKDIARLLDIAPDTVKTHLRNIFDKLGVANRAEAAAVTPWARDDEGCSTPPC